MGSKFSILLGAALLISMPALAETNPEIQREIDKSVAAFPGNCPCPYSKDKSGQMCGERSAYSEGLGNKYGYTPFCYPSDVHLLPIVPPQPNKKSPSDNAKTEINI